MLQQMLDLDRDVVGHVGMRGVQRLDDAHRVRRAVEEIGIAEGDVLGARRDLRRDVREHDVRLHDAELPVVDRHDRTVTAEMPAAAARLRVADDAPRRRRGICSVAYRRQRRQARPIGHEEMKPRQRITLNRAARPAWLAERPRASAPRDCRIVGEILLELAAEHLVDAESIAATPR